MHCLVSPIVFFRVVPWRSALGALAIALSMNLDSLGRSARAAELEGFGPIKFGMTVVQAKEALFTDFGRSQADQLLGLDKEPFFDETSLKIENDRLSYRIFIEDLNLRLDVVHGFQEGRASHVLLSSLLRSIGQKKDRERCTTLGWTLARGIEKSHGVSPGIRVGKLEEGFEEEFLGRVVDLFLFTFESGAYIKMETIWEIDGDCHYYIGYNLPHRNISQF